jgi:hypothetical protein
MRAVAKVSAFFLIAFDPLDAVSLRAAPANVTAQTVDVHNASNKSSSDDASQALDAVMSMVGSIQAQQEQDKPRPRAPIGKGTRPKLDVGFTQYEQKLTETLASTINAAVPMWDNTTRQNIIAKVTSNVSAELKIKLKPLKEAIGKTWMVLPEDAQVVYAAQLKQNFQSVYADSLENVRGHVKRCKARIDIEMNKHKPLPQDQLMDKVESFYIDAVALDRCYGGEELIQMSLLELFASSATTVVEEDVPQNSTGNHTGNHTHKLKKFCLNSLLTNLASRLHDAQSLLSMSMRFEAHAPMDMDMIQTQKNGLKHHKMHMN